MTGSMIIAEGSQMRSYKVHYNAVRKIADATLKPINNALNDTNLVFQNQLFFVYIQLFEKSLLSFMKEIANS